MTARTIYFLAALVCLLAWRVFFLPKQKEASATEGAPAWRLFDLLLASALTIFLELAIIRWIAVEIRIFAYIKNLALLVCFLGFGLGCALARTRIRWVTAANALLGLLIVARWPLQNGKALEGLSQALGGASDVEIWGAATAWHWTYYLLAAVVALLLLLLITYIFLPLGQFVSRQIDEAPSALQAYSLNLLGSLVGIGVFVGLCRLMSPPVLWFTLALAAFAWLQPMPRDRYRFAALMIPAALLLHDPATAEHFTVWSPYQQIEFQAFRAADGELVAANLLVNHIGYQVMLNLDPQFLAAHPGIVREAPRDNHFNLPFRFAKAAPSVLIVGAGAGNDAAAALRNHSRSTDAVEIDPAILEIGKRWHPERPYDSSLVRVHLTDARNFLKRTRNHYDLIIFGALDSHTGFSDYSNMRLDNFVYTLESIQEAQQHLSPDGVLFLKFQVDRPWLGERLQALVTSVFGKPPVVFRSNLSARQPTTCFAISSSGQVEAALRSDSDLFRLVSEHRAAFPTSGTPVTTDDWPYLYQQGQWIPRTYYSVGLLVVLLALVLYLSIPEARGTVPSLFFLSMGAAFLLLETQAVSRLALYFGTTWQVNAIAIGALLSMLLAANSLAVSRGELWRPVVIAGLLASLAAAYFIPFDRIPGSAPLVGSLVACAFAVPVLFAGLVFAGEFRVTPSPSAALAANMLGAVLGGLLENVSLVTGLRALLLLVIAFYLVAALSLRLSPATSR